MLAGVARDERFQVSYSVPDWRWMWPVRPSGSSTLIQPPELERRLRMTPLARSETGTDLGSGCSQIQSWNAVMMICDELIHAFCWASVMGASSCRSTQPM